MRKLKIDLIQGGSIPRWYGLSYYRPEHDSIVCYPIPFHLVIRWLRHIMYFIKFAGAKDDKYLKAYNYGYEKGKTLISILEYNRGVERGKAIILDYIQKDIDDRSNR